MINRQRLQAPRENGAVLIEPPLSQAAGLLAHNRALFETAYNKFWSRSWSELRREARQGLLSGDRPSAVSTPGSGATDLILMAGHQPELFHPGVWLKNFVLFGLARQLGATPVNLVVDSDIVKTTSIRVPIPSERNLVASRFIEFDEPTTERPFEEAEVRNEELFRTFPRRVQESLAAWSIEPCVTTYWNEVLRAAEHSQLLGERLAAGRRSLEVRWGCHNLEIPVSDLCQKISFVRFVYEILGNLARFREIYNDCIREYRRRHRVRSRSHPAPELSARNEWLEAPFWVWRKRVGQRQAVWTRQNDDGFEIQVGDDTDLRIRFARQVSDKQLLGEWRQLDERGIRFRTRALTTTLYVRLFLADLFLHGIGGAKYDELTDDIIRRFWELPAPAYLAVSGTLRLPLPGYAANEYDRQRLLRLLHDLRCNPQRHLPSAIPESAKRLAAEKAAWVARQAKNRTQSRERFRKLKELTRALEPFVADRKSKINEELASIEEQLRANHLVNRRDYAFCLFPEAQLKEFCTPWLQLDQLLCATGT
ncbi:MAG: hypothetical protein KatS3mg105_4246 [Gemmatales bacterium]|nr:MAG: hypothetical protein KatS3mg105_4246 [Gemmatales bacterium]